MLHLSRAKTLIKITFIVFLISCNLFSQSHNETLRLNELGYFETRGLNILVFSNEYDVMFQDAKMAGVEIIHHGVRTVTNGDVRLDPTPEQWDSISKLVERKIQKDNRIEVNRFYSSYDFYYKIIAEGIKNGIRLAVYIEKPLPKELEGRAGFNLEFLPSAYFEKSYLMDGKTGIFPLYPTGPMEFDKITGNIQPLPIAKGKKLVLAPEDPERRIVIETNSSELMLYDGRNKAQNGWFVVRTLIPPKKRGVVIEWFITANTIPNWIRQPMLAYSQVGYHPQQKKICFIELDPNDTPREYARLLKVDDNGQFTEVLKAEVKKWGKYLRYHYYTFDFSQITETGIYIIEYGNVRSKSFRIDQNVYEDAWHATLDIYFPVQMDHMYVKEAYRVWHGLCHMDDALQAPVNHRHFDLYAQGPTTDSPYKPGEHIPGLNVGGWFDAGDFDIRTQTLYSTIEMLVHLWEMFRITRDETYIDQNSRVVYMHHPDGKPDILQQIEHGTLALISQYRAIGHAIPGIIENDLSRYTHLGDAGSKTDNRIYNPALKPYETDGFYSGTFDDRWAFTSKSTALDYGAIAALASASRALKGFNDSLATECLVTAKRIWDEEHNRKPVIFRYGNTTGGFLFSEEFKAAVELLICSKEDKYAKRIAELMPDTGMGFMLNAFYALRAIPYMDNSYKEKIRTHVIKYKDMIQRFEEQNPFGVPITTGLWAGNGAVIGFSITNYMICKTFPDILDKEHVLSGLNYIYGCHPYSNVSFVSGVGTVSKKIAYGNNRADYSFIAGGIVPGVLVLKPDFPENKEDWPFLWGENEYVIGMGPNYMFLVNAVNDLLNAGNKAK